ncbi:hypothetical protein GCM10009676_35380 [Prauserella halophila]|uniref:Uncharacterized protein n=1 Tax=Prauserella halophila TaxID=185641 RepID=A0ABN1WGQ5_9PSEU
MVTASLTRRTGTAAAAATGTDPTGSDERTDMVSDAKNPQTDTSNAELMDNRFNDG